jgi:L-lactate dehydrogenase complex protein LldG
VSEAGDAVLARLRRAIGRTPEEEERARELVRARLAAPRPNLVPARGRLEPGGRVALFIEMARKVATDVERLPDLLAVPAAAAAYLRRHNVPQKLVVAPAPVLDECRWESQPLMRLRRGTALPADAAGLTLAAAGIAETGTLMLVSSPELPTLLAFLPETSIVLLPADWIDGAYEESWQRLRDVLGQPPRSVSFVTGPSRTGDIAQTIELGAHGPRRLLVLIIDELPADLRAAG